MPYGNLNVDTVTTSTTGGILGAGNASIMKNRIINGAMVIDQRNAGASVTSTTSQPYTVDRWQAQASASSKYTVQQNAGSVTPPVGFTNYLGVTSSAATSVSGADYYAITQKIEGYNVADLGWGTANAKTVTLSFWVRSSLTGTFGGALQNGNQDRSYPFTYTISAANTWEQKSVTITGDTTGTWGTTTGSGIILWVGLGVGSTYSGTAGAWAAGLYVTTTGATSVVGTSGATFYITGVQLEVGSSATGFEYRQYGTELALCQRYLPAFNTIGNGQAILMYGSAYSTTRVNLMAQFLVTPRASPTGITTTGSFAIADGVTGTAVTGIISGGSGLNNFFVDIAVGSAVLTLYRPMYLITQTSNSQILFTGAEL
jgi:hypothetical protein